MIEIGRNLQDLDEFSLFFVILESESVSSISKTFVKFTSTKLKNMTVDTFHEDIPMLTKFTDNYTKIILAHYIALDSKEIKEQYINKLKSILVKLFELNDISDSFSYYSSLKLINVIEKFDRVSLDQMYENLFNPQCDYKDCFLYVNSIENFQVIPLLQRYTVIYFSKNPKIKSYQEIDNISLDNIKCLFERIKKYQCFSFDHTPNDILPQLYEVLEELYEKTISFTLKDLYTWRNKKQDDEHKRRGSFSKFLDRAKARMKKKKRSFSLSVKNPAFLPEKIKNEEKATSKRRRYSLHSKNPPIVSESFKSNLVKRILEKRLSESNVLSSTSQKKEILNELKRIKKNKGKSCPDLSDKIGVSKEEEENGEVDEESEKELSIEERSTSDLEEKIKGLNIREANIQKLDQNLFEQQEKMKMIQELMKRRENKLDEREKKLREMEGELKDRENQVFLKEQSFKDKENETKCSDVEKNLLEDFNKRKPISV